MPFVNSPVSKLVGFRGRVQSSCLIPLSMSTMLSILSFLKLACSRRLSLPVYHFYIRAKTVRLWHIVPVILYRVELFL